MSAKPKAVKAITPEPVSVPEEQLEAVEATAAQAETVPQPAEVPAVESPPAEQPTKEALPAFKFVPPPIIEATPTLPENHQNLLKTLVSRWITVPEVAAQAGEAVCKAVAAGKLAIVYVGEKGPVVAIEHDLKFDAMGVTTATVRRGRILQILNDALRIQLINQSA